MNRAARSVMDELEDVVLGFGESDEYRWVMDLPLSQEAELSSYSSAF
jgi:tRNA(His) 5'-end guanylyltransferase